MCNIRCLGAQTNLLVGLASPEISTMTKRRHAFELPIAKRHKKGLTLASLVHKSSDVFHYLIAPFVGLHDLGPLAQASKYYAAIVWEHTKRHLLKTRFTVYCPRHVSLSLFEPPIFQVVKATPTFLNIRQMNTEKVWNGGLRPMNRPGINGIYMDRSEPWFCEYKAPSSREYGRRMTPEQRSAMFESPAWLTRGTYEVKNPTPNLNNKTLRKRYTKAMTGIRLTGSVNYKSWGDYYFQPFEKIQLQVLRPERRVMGKTIVQWEDPKKGVSARQAPPQQNVFERFALF